jgi:glycosyltransferase involved in cell wall biosynthesis
MSAFNEEKVIVAKVESLLAMAVLYGPADVHVYVDGPTDGTADLIRPYADRIDLVISEQRRGKTYGLNLLVERSMGEMLLFTDANVVSDDSALVRILAPFDDPTIGCASAQLTYVNPGASATSTTGAIYWRIEEQIKRIETSTVGMIGVDGAMFMIRRDLYRPAPPYLIDDLFVSLSVLIQGKRTVSVDGVTVLERSAVLSEEEFKRKKRIACQALNVHKALWPQLRRMRPLALYAYVSHRLIKWFLPYFAFIGSLCVLGLMALHLGVPLAAGITAAGLAILFGLARIGFRPAMIVSTALFSLCGVALGIAQSILTDQTYTVWDPAMSVRDENEADVSPGTPS